MTLSTEMKRAARAAHFGAKNEARRKGRDEFRGSKADFRRARALRRSLGGAFGKENPSFRQDACLGTGQQFVVSHQAQVEKDNLRVEAEKKAEKARKKAKK